MKKKDLIEGTLGTVQFRRYSHPTEANSAAASEDKARVVVFDSDTYVVTPLRYARRAFDAGFEVYKRV